MKFLVKQENLKEELSFVQGIVEKRSAIPVLSGILIESVGKDKIRMTSTDLDTTLVTTIQAEVLEEGAICVPAKKLFDIIRLLEPGNVVFTKEGEEHVQIESGRSSFRLIDFSEDSFPEVPSISSLDFSVDSSSLSTFIQMTSFAITQDQIRYTLSGAKFESRNGKIRMVTTDGHRLALIEQDLTAEGTQKDFDILIPKKALMELAKLAKEKETCKFGEDSNLLYFQIGFRTLIVRKLTGQFPNYEMVIPKSDLIAAEFDANEMRAAIRRVSIMADERNRAIKLTLDKGIIEIESETQEEGFGHETISADYDGEKITIGFNAQYIQDFFNVVSADTATTVEKEAEGEKARAKVSSTRVRFEFKDSNSQVVLRPLGERSYNYIYVLMPLRV